MTPTGHPRSGPPAPAGGPPRRMRRRRFRRTRALLGRIPHPPLRSKRGILLLVFLAVSFGGLMTMGSVAVLHYTETAAFCGRCHTMAPELAAYKMSAHRDVPCAECHVAPGIGGFLKAKLNGTKQVVQILTGSYPKPIPPPEHSAMPSPRDTCMRCHALDNLTKNGGPVKLVLRPRFLENEANTRQMLALALRPVAAGDGSGARGVHWHVDQKVEFASSEEGDGTIDLIRVTGKDGSEKIFLARDQVSVSSDVRPDIERLLKEESPRQMECTDCHNRVGHGIPRPDRAVDELLAAGRISPDLPWIKRDAVDLLNKDYPSVDDADAAIARLRQVYAAKYPLVLKMRSDEVNQAVKEIQLAYRLVATPAMKVTAKTYPNNLGHVSSPGCFRCHGGGHYRVVKNRLTPEKVPWACATCHTFPEAGPSVSGISLGGKPKDHRSSLWVFRHKRVTSSLEPAGTSCGTCHSRAYCENCHQSGALQVKHDEMYYNHPSVIAKAGVTACSYCHQPVACARCHKNPVLKPTPEAPHPAREAAAPP